jgi:hypothetical protein
MADKVRVATLLHSHRVGVPIVVWKLNPADLRQLKGGGGELFVHFMDRLIRAEAVSGGLVGAAILTQLRVNIKDGGVDTEVKQAIPQDKSGWFAEPTCWQFKAVDGKEIDAKSLQEEIHKPYARELIKKGYGYRFCLLGDLTPEKLGDWETQLKEQALAITPQARDPRVVHGGSLLEWAERFPAIVAYLRNWTRGGFHWRAWQDNCRAVTQTYVPNPEWKTVTEQILRHGQLGEPSVGGEACLLIGGAAGVGKTRLTFETLNELPEAPSLVLYIADEHEARAVATAIVNTPGQSAILVADECSPPTRHFLSENLRGHAQRVRMICLDNTAERLASAAGQIWLKADSLTNTEAVLAANFPEVPEDRRRRYALLSKGFVRFAADMCKHDAELARGDMSRLLFSVEDYVRERLRRMGNEFLPIVSLLALFHKVGSREDVVEELDGLWPLTPYTRQQFYDVVRGVRESPGFVVQAGRYWYVSPEIVARVLFAEGWERWVGCDLKGFFGQLPAYFLQQLLERVATHAKEEVRTQVGTFFRRWFAELTARDLTEPAVTSLAATLVETAPAEYLPRLRAVIEGGQPGNLQKITGHPLPARWGPRRTLVWLLERLVSFPEFFPDCEACLFRLALEESEQQIVNNATAIWANLFSVYLSGTATPFEQRLPVLRQRTGSSSVSEARLGFAGLARALQRSEGHVLGEPVVAGRLRPTDWHPATVGEERACYRSALAICEQHLTASVNEHHRLAFQTLVDSLFFLLRRGLADELARIITPQSVDQDEGRKVLQIVDEFLEREERVDHAQANERAVAYIQSVRAWSNLFRPTDFTGRLRGVCARSPWDRRFDRDLSKEQDEIAHLAASIVQQPQLLAAELDWLVSPEAQSAERLGVAIGAIDGAGHCGRMIFEHAITSRVPSLLRGYIRGMVHDHRSPSADLLTLMARLEATHPELAVDILPFAGDSFDALNRMLRLVDSGTVSARYLANLAMGLGLRELTTQEVNRLIPYFTRAAATGEAATALAGVRFLETYLLFESRHAAQTCLTSASTQTLAWQLVESVLPFMTGHNGSEWVDILKKLAAFDADRAARLLGEALLAENLAFRETAERELSRLALTHPESVMEGFGSALLDAQRGWVLQVAVCRDLVGQLPVGTVLKWVRAHGIEAAAAIARHLPRPGLDEAGNPVVPQVLDAILREYDDDRVFVNFLGGAHSGEAWWGNGGDQFRRTADEAKRFLTHPNRRIREWASQEIDFRLDMAEQEDQEHEERFLPS